MGLEVAWGLVELEVEFMQFYCLKLRVFLFQKDSQISFEALLLLQLTGWIELCLFLLQILIKDLEADQRIQFDVDLLMLLISHILFLTDLPLKLILYMFGLFGQLLFHEFDLFGEGIAHAVDLVDRHF